MSSPAGRPASPAARIRPARPAEYDRIGELTVAVYGGEGLVGQDYLPRLRDAAGRAAAGELLVATDPATDELVGTVLFIRAGSPYADIARDGEAEFRMLAVAPTARGRGVGTALVAACLDRARALGAHRVVMSTGRRMTAAQRLYEQLGFRRTPERDWSPVPDGRLLTYAIDL